MSSFTLRAISSTPDHRPFGSTLAPSPPRLHLRPSSLWLNQAPSSHRLHLGQSSLYHHLKLLGSLMHSIFPHPLLGSSIPQAPPQSSLTLASSQSSSPLAPPWLLVTGTPPRYLGPIRLRLCHTISLHHFIHPPSVPPWATFILAASWVALDSCWLSAPPWILPLSTSLALSPSAPLWLLATTIYFTLVSPASSFELYTSSSSTSKALTHSVELLRSKFAPSWRESGLFSLSFLVCFTQVPVFLCSVSFSFVLMVFDLVVICLSLTSFTLCV